MFSFFPWHIDAFRWLLDTGNIVQPIESENSLELEAERELLGAAGTTQSALQHAAAGIDESWQHGGIVGGVTGELHQLQSVLGLLFGGQVSLTRGHVKATLPHCVLSSCISL